MNINAYYVHNNGDKDPITVQDYDGKGNAWVTWKKDGFKNMIPVHRIIYPPIPDDVDVITWRDVP